MRLFIAFQFLYTANTDFWSKIWYQVRNINIGSFVWKIFDGRSIGRFFEYFDAGKSRSNIRYPFLSDTKIYIFAFPSDWFNLKKIRISKSSDVSKFVPFLNLFFRIMLVLCSFRTTYSQTCGNRPPYSQFHQHFTRKLFVQTLLRQLFSSYMYIEKAAKTTFVQKICA